MRRLKLKTCFGRAHGFGIVCSNVSFYPVGEKDDVDGPLVGDDPRPTAIGNQVLGGGWVH